MSDMSNTFLKDTTEDSEEDNSDDNLKIVETPSPKRKAPLEPSKSKKLIIESIEDELEKRLEEKAAKTKLNAKLVKNIIKHVITNEHVLALVKKAENPSAFKETIPYEPKPTRAKAKKLKSRIPILPVLRATSKPTSEVQVLSSEDLQEDASGDEYIPGKEESEDDRDSSVFSDPPSVSPATPPTPIPNTDPSIEANWSEDGVFKILSSKRKEYNEEEGNIVRRTKSKLCLSSTPLEVIEEAFIPSDIKTDMYDMNSDNDDWKDCFKKFTRPLDEIVKKEDEEQGPEYNILADVVIDKMDHEELIVDKDVKITRKELNDLKAELFDDADTCTTNDVDRSITKVDKSARNLDTEQSTANNQSQVLEITDTSKGAEQNAESLIVDINDSTVTGEDKCEDVTIRGTQIVLIEQQMRQHVQLLTQNFFLTYHHPELHHYSIQMKEYLLNLKLLSEGKTRSMFFTMNLNGALKLVEDWQTLLESDNEEVKEMKLHVKKTIVESTERKRCGYPYVVTFPKLLMETISKSEVFLYPSLLPKIPFKSPKIFPKNLASYTDSEDYLIALGLEQFIPLARHDKINARTGEVTLKSVCSYIKECIMPHKGLYQIQRHVGLCKNSRTASNPIKYYFQNKKSPPVVHYVCTLSKQQILPPCKRLPNELPYQWKMFIYPSSG